MCPSPKSRPWTRIQMWKFIWEVIPGSTRKIIGKVKQERVPVKSTLINRFLLTFNISKLNSWKKSEPIFLSNFISSTGILPVLAEFLESSLTAHLLILYSQSTRTPNDCLSLPCYHLGPGTIASHMDHCSGLLAGPGYHHVSLASLQQHSSWPSSFHSFPTFHGPFSTM